MPTAVAILRRRRFSVRIARPPFRHGLRQADREIIRPAPPPTERTIMSRWIEACAVGAVEAEDVIRFDHGDRTFAVYRSPDDRYFATDGLCTHEKVHLADGLVMDNIIECPKHNGRFDYRSGAAKGAPVCVDLKTYPVKVEGGKVMIDIG
jgi:3-phenylpropionate/trans-cinnamate dioxygenase ferredoxin component